MEYALFLRLLAERVYTARLPGTGQLRDVSDFHAWLTELADRAEVHARETMDAFVAELG